MKNEITVGLADDHVLLRKGLAGMLMSRGFNVVVQADNGKHLIDQLGSDCTPDIVLLDINMPIMDGYLTAEWMHKNFPSIRILALTVNDDDQSIIRMLHAGARGYLFKDTDPDQLFQALVTLKEKGYYYSEMISSKLYSALQQDNNGKTAIQLLDLLTEKEKDFLRLSCSEMTYKEIAAQMGISPRTVDGYRDTLFTKLQVRSRVGLVLFAIRYKLVTV